MKHQKFNKKLILNKKTIAALQNNEMKKVYGYGEEPTGITCPIQQKTHPTQCYGTYCASLPYCVC